MREQVKSPCAPAQAGVQDFVPAWAPAFAGEQGAWRAA
jgi:hypothetical protein